jgi:hypothetical protein
VLLEMFRAAKAGHGGDPVAAWAEITGNPELAARYKQTDVPPLPLAPDEMTALPCGTFMIAKSPVPGMGTSSSAIMKCPAIASYPGVTPASAGSFPLGLAGDFVARHVLPGIYPRFPAG